MSGAGRKKTNTVAKEGQSLWKYKLAGATALCMSAAVAAYLFLHTSPFPLKQVKVFGNKNMSGAEVRAIMGIEGNEDLMRLKIAGLARSLMQSPWITSVSVRKQYPGTLLVKVEESYPFALLREGQVYFMVDEQGVKLDRLKGEPMRFMPVISADRGISGPEVYGEALRLVRALRRAGLSTAEASGLSNEGGQIEVTGLEGGSESLVVKLDGMAVKVGAGGYKEKLRRLINLRDVIKKRWDSLEYVDLRFANRVVVRPAKGVN